MLCKSVIENVKLTYVSDILKITLLCHDFSNSTSK